MNGGWRKKGRLRVLVLQLFGCVCARDRSTLSDRIYEFQCSSLNTRLICVILSAFERREHSQDNANLENAKTLFICLGRTYNEYFRR